MVAAMPSALRIRFADEQLRDLGTGELPVEIGTDQLTGVVHVNDSRKSFRPRWIRLRTVPTGTATARAISS